MHNHDTAVTTTTLKLPVLPLFLQQKPSAEQSHTYEPQYFAPKRDGPQRYIRLTTNLLHYHNKPVTTTTTTTNISIVEALRGPSHTSEPQYFAPRSVGPQRYINFYSSSLVRNHHIPLNPHILLQKAWDLEGTLKYAPISCTTTIHQKTNYNTTTTTTTISTAES